MGRIAIRAAVVEAPGGPFHFETLAMDPPGPDQIRVRLHACGICHTDMVMRDGALPTPFPVILGHEGAGVVNAVGSAIDDVAGPAMITSQAIASNSCRAISWG